MTRQCLEHCCTQEAVFFFQICTDIDECSEDPPKCAEESKCINTMVRILENGSLDELAVMVSICVLFANQPSSQPVL